MKQSAKGSMILIHLRKHWFKVAFMTILLYLFVQRDFRLSINMNSPTESMEVSPKDNTFQKAPKKDIFTEKKKEKEKILDKFEMPSIFGSPPKSSPIITLERIDDQVKHDYLKRFAKVVINERRKFGVPSSILLACGLLQSHAGQRDLSKAGNNHFALKCTLDWEGASASYQGNCYRHYDNAWSSFRDHSLYLTTGKYGQLATLESTDYRTWAKYMEELNYGGGIDNLAKHLTNIIEEYGLDELDRR